TGGVSRPLGLPAADVLAASPTALAIAIDRRHVDGQCATGRLALAPIDGGVPRVLARDIQEADFLPGGDEPAGITRPPGAPRPAAARVSRRRSAARCSRCPAGSPIRGSRPTAARSPASCIPIATTIRAT